MTTGVDNQPQISMDEINISAEYPQLASIADEWKDADHETRRVKKTSDGHKAKLLAELERAELPVGTYRLGTVKLTVYETTEREHTIRVEPGQRKLRISSGRSK